MVIDFIVLIFFQIESTNVVVDSILLLLFFKLKMTHMVATIYKIEPPNKPQFYNSLKLGVLMELKLKFILIIYILTKVREGE